MKVLHIIDTLGLGGAQTILKSLFENWTGAAELHLLALRQRDQEIKIDHPNVQVLASTKKYSIAPALKKIAAYVSEHSITVLHCHLFRSEVIGYLYKRIYNSEITLVFHEHGQIVASDTGSRIEDFIYRKFKTASIGAAHSNIAVSKAMAEKLQERAAIPFEKIRLLYNFVDLNHFSPENKANANSTFRLDLGIPADAFVFGFAGRIIERKGWRILLDAAEKMKNEKCYFLIAGNGADLELLQNRIAKMKTKSVHLLGQLDNMLAFYKAIDCFVLPSHFEGLPMSQMETLACGVPLITTDGPGMNEVPVDGESALFFNYKDSDSLAEKMQQLSDDKKLQERLANNGLKRVQRFSLDQFMLGLTKIYQEID